MAKKSCRLGSIFARSRCRFYGPNLANQDPVFVSKEDFRLDDRCALPIEKCACANKSAIAYLSDRWSARLLVATNPSSAIHPSFGRHPLNFHL